MPKSIAAEWRKHNSSFARSWLVSMVSRKLVDRRDIPANETLRAKLSQMPEHDAIPMLKDVMLIEAALARAAPVLSLDETVREKFHNSSAMHPELQRVMWANPAASRERVLEWIKGGARPEHWRRLGAARSR